MDENNRNPLDLGGLTMEKLDFSRVHEITEELNQIKKECKEKYGDNWWEHYVAITNPKPDYDTQAKSINECIYHGHEPFLTGHPEAVILHMRQYKARMQELFGHFYNKHVIHKPNEPKVNKRLLKDALKTGKWKELPDELQAEYHKMKDGEF